MCVCIWLASLYITIVAGHVDMKYCISFTYFEWKLSTNVYLISSLSSFQLYIYIYILSEINPYPSIKWQKFTKTRPSNANIKPTYHVTASYGIGYIFKIFAFSLLPTRQKSFFELHLVCHQKYVADLTFLLNVAYVFAVLEKHPSS